MGKKILVALAGNPNSGKTTIFNNLTGMRQHVGNYPGVTVERKEGFCTHRDSEMRIVDLPGAYSLSAYSAEEAIARNFLVNEKPDVVVSIIDSSNLERNLYLAVQLLEFGAPLVMAFNMSDEAKARGYEFDLERLSEIFSAPIVKTVGHKKEGMEKLLDAIAAVAQRDKKSERGALVNYGREIEAEIAAVQEILKQDSPEGGYPYDLRWLAVTLLEQDKEIEKEIHLSRVKDQVTESLGHLKDFFGESPSTEIASRRYGLISGACQEAVRSTVEMRHTTSDKIDDFFTNRILGLPIFLVMMYLVFTLTFTLGEPPMGWIESFFAFSAEKISGLWPAGSESAVKSLLIDGIINGVGGVIIFLPNIFLLFLAIAFLEDSGYMARAAFIMDRIMHKIGLHGKSFMPMLIGFGCSIPAIMATRSLENRRDRLTTMMVIPLMSCGARLPIYSLIIPAFFPQAWRAPMLWLIYSIGIILAVITAKILRVSILKGESVPLVMELPPYRMPTLKSVLLHMWERGWLYLKKAGTVILGISILLWAMTSYPGLPEGEKLRFEQQRNAVTAENTTQEQKDERMASIDNNEAEAAIENSIMGSIGRGLEPLLKPMGFDWRIGTALIGGLAAKEVVVSQLGIVYSVGEADEESESLREKLTRSYSPLIGFAIMLFTLISAPCMATFAVTWKESGSLRWALLQFGGLTLLAYLITIIVYQAGALFGIGL
jgi:ferrous iron transport protein B